MFCGVGWCDFAAVSLVGKVLNWVRSSEVTAVMFVPSCFWWCCLSTCWYLSVHVGKRQACRCRTAAAHTLCYLMCFLKVPVSTFASCGRLQAMLMLLQLCFVSACDDVFAGQATICTIPTPNPMPKYMCSGTCAHRKRKCAAGNDFYFF